MKHLATLLGKSPAEVKRLVDELESKTGYQSTDVRFLSEHQQAWRQKVADLGLDGRDTTGPELYHALQARFQRDSDLLDRALGVSASTSADAKLKLAKQLLDLAQERAETWSLKNPALKTVIRQLPPKRTMKLLGYRSVESMLKRQEPAEILAAAASVESLPWRRKLQAACHKLDSTSFELRRVKFVGLNLAHHPLVVAEPLSGTIAINQQLIEQNSVLSLALAISEELEKISPQAASNALSSATPSLAWWRGLEHLAALHADGAVVSFNLKDVARNWANRLDYARQTSSRAADEIRQKLSETYQQVAGQLPVAAEEVVEPEPENNHIAALATEAVEI